MYLCMYSKEAIIICIMFKPNKIMLCYVMTEHHLEFLSLKVGCRGSSEVTHVKMPYFWKSHALAHMYIKK